MKSNYVLVDGIRTHYLEAGEGPTLVLLHSGEFGACAELTWEFNIDALAKHFHVLAPDWLGYGRTEKLFSFDDMWGRRVRHIQAFLRPLCVDKAHFMGNSMGGSALITVAAMEPNPWPMDRIVVVSGGGFAPDNEVRQILNSYDCSLEHMRRIVELIFVNPAIRNDEAYVRRRHELSLEPGAWECTAAVRFKAPGRASGAAFRPKSYATIGVPTLIVAGEQDNLREPGYAQALQAEIPGAALQVMADAGHCPQIDRPEEFNRIVVNFLERE